MTAISAPRTSAGTTPFERSLLRAASALDRFVARASSAAPAPSTAGAAAVQSASGPLATPLRRAARSGCFRDERRRSDAVRASATEPAAGRGGKGRARPRLRQALDRGRVQQSRRRARPHGRAAHRHHPDRATRSRSP